MLGVVPVGDVAHDIVEVGDDGEVRVSLRETDVGADSVFAQRRDPAGDTFSTSTMPRTSCAVVWSVKFSNTTWRNVLERPRVGAAVDGRARRR